MEHLCFVGLSDHGMTFHHVLEEASVRGFVIYVWIELRDHHC